MKKALLYLLAFTYTLSVLKPTLPFVYDAVGHAFFYQHHIATVHMVNGKQHVHHEFIRDVKKGNSDSNSSGFKKIIPTDEHLSLPFYHRSLESVFVKQLFRTGNIKLAWRPISGKFPPPKHSLA